MSQVYDLEKSASPPADEAEGKSIQKKASSLRTWGPAMVAIAGVIAVNAALLGPTGDKIPALTERHLTSQNLAEKRTKAVLEMDFDSGDDHKLFRSNRGFGSRNLGERMVVLWSTPAVAIVT